MLQLKNIVKNYLSGESEVHALRGIDITFRKNEFVSVLGPSGCGKTTLLNIIGGLDRYSEGDLLIQGRSTMEFRSRDWDAYRNHSVGFVFQSYNLIPHQSVLSNVELALTIAGVSKSERRRRAKEALEKVGLGDQLKKRPAQMSGGQMQRVAIARALVNNPEIVLADEPTGALDSETSVQVMELLREIARDRLVIMVTHNPDLAQEYSTRIIRLSDGKMISDSNPYTETAVYEKPAKQKKEKKPSMSFFTALSLSLNNLMTKRGRTVLTSFAGSIGIIGIALITAISTGINAYIDTVQEDTLSSYPITLQRVTQDYSAMMNAMGAMEEQLNRENEDGVIYVDDSAGAMMSAMASTRINDLQAFRTYLEAHRQELDGAVSNIQYEYDYDMQIYSADGLTRVSPTTIFQYMGDYFTYLSSMMGSSSMGMDLADMFNIFSRMQDNPDLLRSQYDLIDGKWAEGSREIMLVLDQNNSISNMATYILGLNDQTELEGAFDALMKGEEYETSEQTFKNEDFIGMKFYIVPNHAFYQKTQKTYTVNGQSYAVWEDIRKKADYNQAEFARAHGIEVTISGIIRPNEDAIAPSISGILAYNSSLSEEMMAMDAQSEVAKQQIATPDTDIFTGVAFASTELTMEAVQGYIAAMTAEEKAQMIMTMQMMTGQEVTEENLAVVMFAFFQSEEGKAMMQGNLTTQNTYDKNLLALGFTDESNPSAIHLYAIDFEGKDRITDLIAAYNRQVGETKEIRYTDLVGLLMSSITTIINVISYVLIAFVSISLVVSSVMIGIITYISVLERTKEIGILRAMGASKKDVSRVFNAETLIVGFGAGAMGILITVLLCFPINAIIRALSGIGNIGAYLPFAWGFWLIVISVVLTVVAGFVPARMASKRDPVEALRSE